MAGTQAAAWSFNSICEAPDTGDWAHFEKFSAELGPGFIRILNYFREYGAKSVAQIELAMHTGNTTGLVIPAHTIKGEARQFGAEPLAAVAELIETTARLCVETQRFPDELVKDVVELKRLFEETVSQFDKATNPLLTRSPQGACEPKANNQTFGRL